MYAGTPEKPIFWLLVVSNDHIPIMPAVQTGGNVSLNDWADFNNSPHPQINIKMPFNILVTTIIPCCHFKNTKMEFGKFHDVLTNSCLVRRQFNGRQGLPCKLKLCRKCPVDKARIINTRNGYTSNYSIFFLDSSANGSHPCSFTRCHCVPKHEQTSGITPASDHNTSTNLNCCIIIQKCAKEWLRCRNTYLLIQIEVPPESSHCFISCTNSPADLMK